MKPFALLFFVCNLLGFREATSVLALTVPEGMTVDRASLYAGLYLIFYFLFTLACPILILASGIHGVLGRWWR